MLSGQGAGIQRLGRARAFAPGKLQFGNAQQSVAGTDVDAVPIVRDDLTRREGVPLGIGVSTPDSQGIAIVIGKADRPGMIGLHLALQYRCRFVPVDPRLLLGQPRCVAGL